MAKPSRKQIIVSWIFQIIASAIFFKAAYGKFFDSEVAGMVFNELKMGDHGKNLIGVIETLSAVMLLTPYLNHSGALLGFGTMLGALIAHLTVLGFNVNNDGGMMVMMMLLNLTSCGIVLFIRRRNFPLIGDTFN